MEKVYEGLCLLEGRKRITSFVKNQEPNMQDCGTEVSDIEYENHWRASNTLFNI